VAAGMSGFPPIFGPYGHPEQYPPLALAYLGDAVYELYVREWLLHQGGRRPGALHRAATGYVRAHSQAEALRALLPELTEVEAEVARRGRNAKPRHSVRGADRAEYALATGFEALVGFLYLRGDWQRLQAVLARAVQAAGGEPPAAGPANGEAPMGPSPPDPGAGDP